MNDRTPYIENPRGDTVDESKHDRKVVSQTSEAGGSDLETRISSEQIAKITAVVKQEAAELANPELKELADTVISEIEISLIKITEDRGPWYLPVIDAWQDNEGDLWIQLESEDFRIGFILNVEINTSQWFQVFSKRIGGDRSFGPLTPDNLTETIKALVDNAVNNS